MTVRIRLARFGKKNRPHYRVHVADSRMKRDGRHLEAVGTYDPIPRSTGHKVVRLNTDRIKYWLSVGAQPSKRVAFILSKFGLIPDIPLATDFTYKRPPPFRSIPEWWNVSEAEKEMILSLERKPAKKEEVATEE